MTSGALCSDHVNYLIFRYLQEAGHENAATAFYRDWHRPHEFRDPENYPWAPVVRRSELVSIIQSGLHHDELQARVRKSTRKFQFTVVSSRDSVEERQDGAGLENGTLGSRPGSSAKRKSRPPRLARPDEEFPTPAPKRRKRSEGSEGVHLNGERERDAMEVDAGSASAEADEDGDTASPAIASEPEMTEIPERYDSMDVAVQTDVKTGPKTSTMYWKVDKPDATILHSMFCPSSEAKNAGAFLAVGASLCRFYQVPESVENAEQVLSIEEPELPAGSIVTASAWHPQGHTAVCALDSVRQLQDDKQDSQQTILSYNRDYGTTEYFVPPLLEPAGILWAIRYNSSGDKLLVLRMNLKRSLLLVYDTTGSELNGSTLIAYCSFEQPVYDVTWADGADAPSFVVCGEGGRVEQYKVQPSSTPTTQLSTALETIDEAKSSQGMDLLISWPDQPIGSDYKWDKARYDSRSNVLAVASTEDRMLSLLMPAEPSYRSDIRLSGQLTAMAIQPLPSLGPLLPALVAVTLEDGSCVVFSAKTNPEWEGLRELLTLQLSEGPALALAWSHNGSYLAIAGTDLVQIWEMDALVRREGEAIERKSSSTRPLVTWRPDQGATGPRNGEHEGEGSMSEPSLSWSADGESLAFAVEKQIAIIRFRPPLNSRDDGVETNGGTSP